MADRSLSSQLTTDACWFCDRDDGHGCAICDDEYGTVEQLRELVKSIWQQRADFEHRYRTADRARDEYKGRLDAIRGALGIRP